MQLVSASYPGQYSHHGEVGLAVCMLLSNPIELGEMGLVGWWLNGLTSDLSGRPADRTDWYVRAGVSRLRGQRDVKCVK